MQPNRTLDHQASGSLSGKRVWLITEGKAGMVVQAEGIAAQLGVKARSITVKPRGFWRALAPWAPVAPAERFGQPGSPFEPPWPDLAIAVGRASIPYIRRLRRAAGMACYTVVLQDPRSGPNTADLIWVPEHDTRRGPNVISTVISPHGFSRERIAALRDQPAPQIDALAAPRVAVILGGRTPIYKYSPEDHARFVSALQSIAELGASFLITTSRRTHPELLAAVEDATREVTRVLWRSDNDGPNPYGAFLAHADTFIVTADSVNMTGEVCATGRPLYVFHPAGGSPKFQRYHQCLEEIGAARPLPNRLKSLNDWSYPPQFSAEVIAAEIERRYWARQQQFPLHRRPTATAVPK